MTAHPSVLALEPIAADVDVPALVEALLPAFQRRGYAAAVIGVLTRIAFDSGAPLVVAHTLPEENASNRALRRNGFAHAAETIDPEDGLVWRWERRCAP